MRGGWALLLLVVGGCAAPAARGVADVAAVASPSPEGTRVGVVVPPLTPQESAAWEQAAAAVVADLDPPVASAEVLVADAVGFVPALAELLVAERADVVCVVADGAAAAAVAQARPALSTCTTSGVAAPPPNLAVTALDPVALTGAAAAAAGPGPLGIVHTPGLDPGPLVAAVGGGRAVRSAAATDVEQGRQAARRLVAEGARTVVTLAGGADLGVAEQVAESRGVRLVGPGWVAAAGGGAVLLTWEVPRQRLLGDALGRAVAGEGGALQLVGDPALRAGPAAGATAALRRAQAVLAG